MLIIKLQGKDIMLLTHKEKAEELGISTKTLTRWKKKGRVKEDNMIKLPQWKNKFFFKDEYKELVRGYHTSSE
jgi:predicted site-specific integrase-resolvase